MTSDPNGKDVSIIINDADCMDSFIDKICSKIRAEGIEIKQTKNYEGIDIKNACVITLDQKVNSGSGIVLVGAYHNNLKNNLSDVLLLCSRAAFQECGYTVDKIVCGVRGYKEKYGDHITNRIPSETENIIDKSSYFVEIELGTEAEDIDIISKGIINTLKRLNNYIETMSVHKYIFRGTNKINFSQLEEIFETGSEDINKMNSFSFNNNIISIDYAYISPKVKSISQFNKE